jgi:hypothetical protein
MMSIQCNGGSAEWRSSTSRALVDPGIAKGNDVEGACLEKKCHQVAGGKQKDEKCHAATSSESYFAFFAYILQFLASP